MRNAHVEAENVVKKIPLEITWRKELWDYQFYFLKPPKEITAITDIKTVYWALLTSVYSCVSEITLAE